MTLEHKLLLDPSTVNYSFYVEMLLVLGLQMDSIVQVGIKNKLSIYLCIGFILYMSGKSRRILCLIR